MGVPGDRRVMAENGVIGPFEGVLGSVLGYRELFISRIRILGETPQNPEKGAKKGLFWDLCTMTRKTAQSPKWAILGGPGGVPGGPPRGPPRGEIFPRGPPARGPPRGGPGGVPRQGPQGGRSTGQGVCHRRCDDQRLTPLIIALPCRSLARATGLALTLACQHQRRRQCIATSMTSTMM